MKANFLLVITSVISFIETHAQKQIESLNGFKYVYVDVLNYDNGKVDIFGLTTFLRESLGNKGFIVLDYNTSAWPAEAKGDPCLVGRWSPEHSGGNRAGYIVRNCKDEIVYENSSTVMNWANDIFDNYRRAMKNAFAPISSAKYRFSITWKPEIIYPSVETYPSGKLKIQ